MTDGIHIPRDLADAEGVPEELDANLLGEYRFPDPSRRRVAGVVYLVLAVVLAVVGTTAAAVAIVAVIGVWHLLAAHPLRIEQEEAAAIAAGAVDFAVGQVSAAVAFAGLRARPRWQVILYPATEPPDRRALVQIDAVTGTLTDEVYVEELA